MRIWKALVAWAAASLLLGPKVGEFMHTPEQPACPTSDEWVAFVVGDIGPLEVSRLVDHMDECSDCAERVRVIALLRASLERER